MPFGFAGEQQVNQRLTSQLIAARAEGIISLDEDLVHGLMALAHLPDNAQIDLPPCQKLLADTGLDLTEALSGRRTVASIAP